MKNIQNTTLDAIRNISQPSVTPKNDTTDTGGGSNTGGSTGGNKNNSSSTTTKPNTDATRLCIITRGSIGGSPSWAGGGTSIPSKPGRTLRFSPNPANGFTYRYATYAGKTATGMSITVPEGTGNLTVSVYYQAIKTETTKTGGGSSSGNSLVKKNLFANSLYAASGAFIESDDTPAILHKGEGVFTASETSALRNMVKNYQTLAANLTGNSLLSAMSGIGSYSFSNTRNAGSELNINPGAVVIHVDKLDDKYDVDELATDVFNKLSTIASKATNRGVNRR